MARVIGGLGTCHSPQVSLPADTWAPYGEQEVGSGRLDRIAYRSAHPDPRQELTPELIASRAAQCAHAITALQDELEQLAPDILVVVGDDQKELFLEDGIAPFAIFAGPEVYDYPPGPEAYPSGMIAAYSAYHAAGPERYEVPAALGRHVVSSLVAAGIDVAIASQQPPDRGLGHAFTFPRLRLTPDKPRPLLPVMINTYFPPNQPTPARCTAFGRALRAAIDSWDDDARVVLVASGGLSHPIVDEELDRAVLDALMAHDEDALAALPVELLDEGNSEIRNWIAVGAALPEATFRVVEYVAGYRSIRGSGCGMGFGIWSLPEN